LRKWRNYIRRRTSMQRLGDGQHGSGKSNHHEFGGCLPEYANIDVNSDFTINCPTTLLSSAFSQHSLPVYKLAFNAGSQVHGATDPFISAITSERGGPGPGYNETIAAYMKDWFVSFVVHLDPNAQSWSVERKPEWPAYSVQEEVMSVNYTQIGAVGDVYYDKSQRCDFWRRNGDIVGN
jgi:hypothetical protein